MWTHKTCHVFDDTEYTHADFSTKIDFFAHVLQRHFLRCGDNDSAVHRALQVLHDGQVLV